MAGIVNKVYSEKMVILTILRAHDSTLTDVNKETKT